MAIIPPPIPEGTVTNAKVDNLYQATANQLQLQGQSQYQNAPNYGQVLSSGSTYSPGLAQQVYSSPPITGLAMSAQVDMIFAAVEKHLRVLIREELKRAGLSPSDDKPVPTAESSEAR